MGEHDRARRAGRSAAARARARRQAWARSREIEPCPVTGKRAWRTEEDALAAGYELQSINRFTLRSNSAYSCQYCGAWHLTGQGAIK